MLRLIWGVFIWLGSFIRSRNDLGLEIIDLRPQLMILKRRTKRAHLGRSDRLFSVLLRRMWPRWSNPLLIVKLDTVVRWHRKGFRLYCRFRSRSKPVGRPVTGSEVRTALHTLANENPTWGAPRIHGELLKLGFEISERTVSRYLMRLHRRDGTAQLWRTFLKSHRELIVAMDFFTVITANFRQVKRHNATRPRAREVQPGGAASADLLRIARLEQFDHQMIGILVLVEQLALVRHRLTLVEQQLGHLPNSLHSR